ncbi:hypothetical protein LCGC14_1370080 [marine sediment metagenome]|uniref:Uncharacterized protein n=1 Tax=marine sediment metagenome TaxID=412755 RepID=A0A0F9MKV1_9ZZZZ
MLPWNEKVPMLSIHPDAATRDDIARLAAELMEANKQLNNARDCLWGRKADYVKNLETENKKLKESRLNS